MYIYNTTYLVTDAVLDEWLVWLKSIHIPEMLKHDFSEVQIAKVLTTDAEQEGTSVTVQFRIKSVEQLNRWGCDHLATLRQELRAKFGEKVLPFDTILEILK